MSKQGLPVALITGESTVEQRIAVLNRLVVMTMVSCYDDG